MKYRCLIFDHDDTVVDSTATIHYPCFVEFTGKYHPDIKFTMEEFRKYNYEPGLLDFYSKICGFSESEMEVEYAYWIEYTKKHRAKAIPGIKEIMEEHKREGGMLAVISHSYRDNILLDYEVNHLPKPDIVYGFEQPRDELKPSPVPVKKIISEFGLLPEEVLVIDDLKPGLVMARAAGVSFAAAGWNYDIPANSAYLRANSDYFCETVDELKEIL